MPFTLEWYVTHKFPLWDEAGRFIGVAASTLAPGVWRPLCSAISNLTALEHIRTHYSEKISVETLASTAGMSRRSFERQFHHTLGCSSMTYLRRVRINAVCRALASSAHSLSEISLNCGYSDQSHMTREFRKLVGETPREYRLRGQH